MKKIIALLLALTALFALASCSGTKKSKGPEKVVLENSYLSRKINLPEGTQFYNVVLSSDSVFLRGSKEVKSTNEFGEETSEWLEVVSVSDRNFGEIKEIFTFKSEYEWDEVTRESTSNYMNNIYPDGKGGMFVDIVYSHNYPVDEVTGEWGYESYSILSRYDATGALIDEIRTDGIFAQITDKKAEEENMTYINRVFCTDDGLLGLITPARVIYVDENEKLVQTSAFEEYSYNEIYPLPNGNFRSIEWDWDKEVPTVDVKEYDRATGETRVLVSLDNQNGNVFLGADGNVYVNDSTDLSRVDLKTGEISPFMNWLNSDVNSDRIGGMFMDDDGIYLMEYDSNYEGTHILHMTPASDGDLVEKYIITLATDYITTELKDMIINYNRSSADYRISVKAYGYGDEGADNFDRDILAGDIPDLVYLNNIDVAKYATKNLFLDLGEMLENDEDISRDDFLPNILSVAEIKGKLYRMPISFSTRSIVGKKSIVGDMTPFNWQALLDLQRQYPDAKLFGDFDRTSLMNSFFPLVLEDFIDYDNATCNFTDGSFARFLEFAKSFPKEFPEDYWENIDWEIYQDRFKNDEELLYPIYLSGFTGRGYVKEQFGDEVSYVGYPVVSDGNGMTVVFDAQFAIGAKSNYKTQAWDFIKSLVSEEYQENDIWNFPVLKSVYEKKKAEAIELLTPKPEDENTDGEFDEDFVVDDMVVMPRVTYGKMIDSVYPIMPEEELYRDTVEDVESLDAMVQGASRLARYNDPVVDIITAEMGAYFDGVKSADETCRIIESRVRLYLSELS